VPSLTGLQLSVMRALWERGEASIADVQKALLPERVLAQTTVATLLSRLERRGVVAHRVDGRQYIYRATVAEPEVRRSMVADLTDALFGGDPAELISHLLASREIHPGDLDRVRELIEAKERSGGGDGER
jgi:BlaI family transcriptional regulator, penicillinase repressor